MSIGVIIEVYTDIILILFRLSIYKTDSDAVGPTKRGTLIGFKQYSYRVVCLSLLLTTLEMARSGRSDFWDMPRHGKQERKVTISLV